MNEKILGQYDHEGHLYSAFTKKVGDLIVEILNENDINPHSITYRLKDRKSLERKLSKSDSHYSDLHEVTDIAGIRITTYFEDDVDRIAQLIEREFEIDRKNSVDKRTLLDPDRFGYLSMHHVVSLSPERCRLTEYRRFPHLKAEIQTRSILQHAWAEIEHDLGYKSTYEVPQSIRRRFSRLAGLLELADQEFISIRDELNSYEQEVPERIEAAPQSVAIDKASLMAYSFTDAFVAELDLKLASFCSAIIEKKEDFISRLVERLQYLGIETIGELDSLINKYANQILGLAKNRLGQQQYERLGAGISIFYLGYVLVAQTNDVERISAYLKKMNAGIPPDEWDSWIQGLLEAYKEVAAQSQG